MRFILALLLLVGATLFLSAHHFPADRCAGPQCAGAGGCSGGMTAAASGFPDIAQQWKDAYNAGDAARVAALYTDDAWYLSAHIAAHGRDQVHAYWRRGINAGGHIESVRVLDTHVDAKLAYVAAAYEANNAGERVRGRNLLVLRNVDGRWLIAAHSTAVADQP